MAWVELCLTVDATVHPRAESLLEELGALSITLVDADAETPDEQAIFEPDVGQTPLWSRVQLTALFAADVSRHDLVTALAGQLPTIAPDHITFNEVEDKAWERVWMDQFKPMQFGQHLWVYPWNIDPPRDDRLAIIRLDPGLAFGTGTHPTTALCLEWLDGLDLAGKHVVDYGCGSGVLSVAALKLGAAKVTGVDNDPQAVTATQDNAERNGVGEKLAVYLPEATPAVQADVFIANILAGPLTELAPHFATLCPPGTPLALSGILAEQQDHLLNTYAPWFTHLTATEKDGWVRLSGIRKDD